MADEPGTIDRRRLDGTLEIQLQPGSIGERFLRMAAALRAAGAVEETRRRQTGWWLGERYLGATHREALAALSR